MGKPASSKEIDRLQTVSRDIASETLKGAQAAGQFKRFPDSALAAADPRFSGITSFLPQGMRSSIPTQYQGMQGQMYANYQTPQKLGAGLTAFGMTPGQTVPIQTGGIGSVSTPLTPPAEDEAPIDVDQDTLDDIVAEIRQDLDMPVMGSYEDMVPKPVPKKATGNIGKQRKIARENKEALERWEEGKRQFEAATNQFSYGGIANLAAGGFLAGLAGMGSKLAAAAPKIAAVSDKMQSIGGAMSGQTPSMGGDDDYENMSREELIALLKGKGTKTKGLVPMIADFVKSKQTDEAMPMAQGGIMYLAKGDMVEDFPRMNGPISGPGTETSDDIPAMLSDGEFVVNAKAVRGVGKLGGANKSKADQRKEGARMMYALQRAGEKAMRGAS
jgi:hypothetical protein